MVSFVRSTRLCTLGEINKNTLEVVNDFFKRYDLGDAMTEAVLCCETVSRRDAEKLSGWGGGVEERDVSTLMILTPRVVVWVRASDAQKPHAAGAELKNIRARVRRSFSSADPGLEISGWMLGAKSRLNGMIPLGPEKEAKFFCDELIAAVDKVNPPRSLLSIFGKH